CCSCRSHWDPPRSRRSGAQPLRGAMSVKPTTRLFSRRALATFLLNTYLRPSSKLGLFASKVCTTLQPPDTLWTRFFPTDREVPLRRPFRLLTTTLVITVL